ncbi:two-component system sensor histidine kinase AgrC [Enterococcus sp. PF1-24]|uniref:sensor histidine kinase n=1 Tax=unclassified Enterococcus TaxID=2608891 RepID=UPI0024767A8E|nr:MULTISPECIES: sensor histidine kinase [unclassified Enterococcus]MDH6363310.1 two-component system sensor histidine kinase AgrC [Enterococcus sp. PFB1-1]MDH6400389.1 two-component system sensor histidine kinase AgrC [Enterococcus sp. PF1-24]
MYEIVTDFITLMTPLLSLIPGFFSLCLTNHFLEIRKAWWCQLLSFIAHSFLVTSMIFIGVGDYIPVILAFGVQLLTLLVLYKGSLLARLSLGVVLVTLPLSINGVLTSVRPPFDRYIFVFRLLCWLSIYLFTKKTLPTSSKPPIRSRRLWILVDFLSIMPVTTVIAVTSFTDPYYLGIYDNPFDDVLYVPQESLLVLMMCLAVLATLTILVVIIFFSRHEKLTEEQQLAQLRHQYYLNMEESQQQLRHLRHDLANHLTALSGLQGAEQQAYLQQLIDSPALKNGQRYCQQEIINAVLSAKVPLFEKNKIPYELNVHIPKEIAIADLDICTLFANSIDNALEANLKLPENQRHLGLHCAVEKGFFVMKLVNSLKENLVFSGDQLITTKTDKKMHGFGLTSMKEITQRYNGTLTIETPENQFHLRILIPI